ncbi:MAG: hypothetical protein H3C45_04345 [Bacteroidia bacterium]|nr:hypothetical protein [Bacteroidia bacterium]
MAISSYPRTIVQNSEKNNNPENGLSLMIFDTVSQKYKAATDATFTGGGGDATAANQTLQIVEAQLTNTLLSTAVSNGKSLADLDTALSLLNAILVQINGGTHGSILYSSDSGVVTGKTIKKLVVNSDCSFSVLVDSGNNDLVTMFGLSGKTLKSGSVILPIGSNTITELTVSDGDVLAYE